MKHFSGHQNVPITTFPPNSISFENTVVTVGGLLGFPHNQPIVIHPSTFSRLNSVHQSWIKWLGNMFSHDRSRRWDQRKAQKNILEGALVHVSLKEIHFFFPTLSFSFHPFRNNSFGCWWCTNSSPTCTIWELCRLVKGENINLVCNVSRQVPLAILGRAIY